MKRFHQLCVTWGILCLSLTGAAAENVIDLVSSSDGKTVVGNLTDVLVIKTKAGENTDRYPGSHYDIKLTTWTQSDYSMFAGLDLEGNIIPCTKDSLSVNKTATYPFETTWNCIVPLLFTDYAVTPSDTLTFKMASSAGAAIAADSIGLSGAAKWSDASNVISTGIMAILTLGTALDKTKTCPGKTVIPDFLICPCPDNAIYNKDKNTCDVFTEPAPTKTLGVAPQTSTNDPKTSCAAPSVLDASGKCIAPTAPPPPAPKCAPPIDVLQVDGSCGSACGANEVEADKHCACKEGHEVDASGKICVAKGSAGANGSLSQTPGSGGGSCSLIRTKDTPPAPNAGKGYELQAIDGSKAGEIQTLMVKYAAGTYTLTATHPLGSQKQSVELVAMEMPSMKVLVPKNTAPNGQKQCASLLVGNSEKFTCLYDMKVNAITDATQPSIFLVQANGSSLMTSAPVVFKDFAVTTALTCAPPKVLAEDKKSCIDSTPAPTCKNTEKLQDGKCIAIADQNAKAPAAAPPENSCSLNPNTSTPNKASLALLLAPMLAAVACRFSKS